MAPRASRMNAYYKLKLSNWIIVGISAHTFLWGCVIANSKKCVIFMLDKKNLFVREYHADILINNRLVVSVFELTLISKR